MINISERKAGNLAYHEAAHFVLCILYEFKVHGISLIEDRDSAGRVYNEITIRPDDPVAALNFCRMTLAGGVAEQLFADTESTGVDGDNSQVLNVLLLLYPPNESERNVGSDNAGLVRHRTINVGQLRHLSMLRRLKEQTTTLLNESSVRDAVDRVVKALKEKGELMGNDAEVLAQEIDSHFSNHAREMIHEIEGQQL